MGLGFSHLGHKGDSELTAGFNFRFNLKAKMSIISPNPIDYSRPKAQHTNYFQNPLICQKLWHERESYP